MRVAILLAISLSVGATDLKPVFPSNAAKPIGPYVPGISAGSFVYVSGQGARDASGNLPATFEEQTRQCLNNVKDILEAAGLTMEHVIWSHVYVADIKNLPVADKTYLSFFPKNPPARETAAVVKMPGDTPVEISVVAIRDLNQRKVISVTPAPVASDAIQLSDRVYVSGILGMNANNRVPRQPQAQVKEALKKLTAVLAKSGLELRNLSYAHIFVDDRMPLKVLGEVLSDELPSETAFAITQTAALPGGAHFEISGIASTTAKRQGACVMITETVYCPDAAGTIEQALQRIKESMAIAKLDLSRVVVSNVFLDDITEFQVMNKVYAGVFGKWLPTRVTLQPAAKGDELNLPPSTDSAPPKADSPRVRMNVVAVR